MSDPAFTREMMRRLPLFHDLPEADLTRLHEAARTVALPAGEFLMREGEPGDALYFILDGELEILKGQGAAEQVLAVRGPGEVLGEMALLERAPRFASARALRDSRLASIDQAAFGDLLACSPTAPSAVLRTVVGRLRSSESLLMQQEKLAALGTMAAGLAHELNNPAAAIQRSAAQLEEVLKAAEASAGALLGLGTAPEPGGVPPRDPLALSEQEGAMQAFLDARGLADAWDLAPALVAAGWSETTLGAALGPLSAERAAALVRWLAASAGARGLLGELRAAAQAISELVGAVKRYSYMDRGPVQEVDIPESLEATLIILRHKMREVAVHREYAPDLPRIEALGGALNQVWTNLIDNAVQAMGGRGELWLRAYARGARVVVEVQDAGPGVPPEIQSRIFEPFFTTKPVGAGSGLGLHLAYTTVVHQHQGRLELTSRPGFTCFKVTLPVRRAG